MDIDNDTIPAPLHNPPHNPEIEQMVWVVLGAGDPYGDATWVHSVWSTEEQASAVAASLWKTRRPDGGTYDAGYVTACQIDRPAEGYDAPA